jgi:ketosteroid isomerase-like protein
VSQENVEIVEAGVAAFSERERDRWLALCDPAIECVPGSDWPENTTISGREAVWDFFLQSDEPWEPGAYELAEAINVPGLGVLANLVRDIRGRDSGATVRYDYWALYRFRAGLMCRVEFFMTRRDALKAVGLQE